MKHVITWFEIPTINFDRAVKFYSEILGEPVKVDDHMGQKYGFFPMDGMEGVGGAIVPPSPEFTASPSGVRVYLNCEDDLDEVINRVEGAGGSIMKPKSSIGEHGWIAAIKDTEGNTVGLHGMK